MYRPKLDNSWRQKDIEFQIIDWVAYDITLKDDEDSDDGQTKWKPKEKRYKAMIYGLTEVGNTVSAHVENFTPYFFIKIPDNWTKRNITELKMTIDKKVNFYAREALIDMELVMRKEFYGFTNDKMFKFARLVFKNYNSYNQYKKLFDTKISHKGTKQHFQLYESNIVPYLRLMHIRDILPSSWVKVKKRDYMVEHDTICQMEISCDWENVHPVKKNKIAPIMVASFDIECTSGDGSFPLADVKFIKKDNYKRDEQFKTRKEDKVIQIGTTFHRYGEKECFLHHIVTLGKSDKIKREEVNAKEVKLECYDTERDVILNWAKFIKKMDPEVITGYNIWGFDMKYLYVRAATGNGGVSFEYKEKLLELLSRNNEKPARFVDKELSSSALGNNFLYYFDMEGRVGIDLLKVVQANHKLDGYKLDMVANHFLKLNKIDLPPKKIFQNFKEGTPDKIKEIAVYCLKDCELVNRLIVKLEIIANSIGMSNVCCVPMSYLFLRGQGIKIYSLVAKQAREEQYLIRVNKPDPKDISKYEGAIVFTPKPGIYMEPVAVNDYASLYPSSMIAENISHDSIVSAKIYDLNDILRQLFDGYGRLMKEYDEKGNLEVDNGELEYDNMEGFKFNEVKFDLYEPYDEEKHKGISLDLMSGSGDNRKVKIGYKICKYAERENGEKHILPRILMKLLAARKSTRKRIIYKTVTLDDGTEYSGIYIKDKGEIITEEHGKVALEGEVVSVRDTYNEFEKAVWDGLQLSYKVCANSLYGQVGSKTSQISYKDLASSCTAVGRSMVLLAKDKTKELYPLSKLVYGDSILGTTPILLRNEEGKEFIDCIENLSINEWVEYENFKNSNFNEYFKEIIDILMPDKEQFLYRKNKTSNRNYQIKTDWMGGKLQGTLYKRENRYIVDFKIDGKKVSKSFNIKKYEKDKDALKDAEKYKENMNNKYKTKLNKYRYLYEQQYNKEFLEVEMTSGKTFLCDVEDLDIVNNYSWWSKTNKDATYAATRGGKGFHTMVLEKYLKQLPKSVRNELAKYDTIDHININERDNRRINLRLANLSQQGHNKKLLKKNKTDIIGLYSYLHYGKEVRWVAKSCNNKIYTKKEFNNKEDALKYRNYIWEKMEKENDDNLKKVKEDIMKNLEKEQSNRSNKEQNKINYEVWTDLGWKKINRIIRHKTVKKIFRVVSKKGIVDVTEDHSLIDNKLKLIKPEKCSTYRTKLLNSYPYEDNNKSLADNEVYTFDNQLDCSKKYFNLKKDGYDVTLDYTDNKYIIKNDVNKNNRISKVILLHKDYTDYVYDFETEIGRYQAGIGENIVSNTDSVFISFLPQIEADHGKNLTDKEKMEYSTKYQDEAARYTTSFCKKPHLLESEKIFFPFIIFSKKRYVGNKYMFPSVDKYKLDYMGIVLKRRDNAPIVKEIYFDIIQTILEEKNIEKGKQFFKDNVKKLLNGDVDLNKLVITKSLRGNYKNPTSIAHKVLADRMGERDPGNKPTSSDRIPYCYIDNRELRCEVCNKNKLNEENCKCIVCMKLYCGDHLHNHRKYCKKMCRFCKQTDKETKIIKCMICRGYYCDKCMDQHKLRVDKKTKQEVYDKCKKPLTNKILQGDKIENPAYIREKNLKIDYLYYLEHQVEVPVLQIFSLAMDKPYSLIEEYVRKYENDKQGLQDISRWFKVTPKENNKEKINDKNKKIDINEVFEPIEDDDEIEEVDNEEE